MTKSDDENLMLAGSAESVDALNREFYTRFPYPGPPMTFPRLTDPELETVMLNQGIGDFTHRTIPVDARIWIAGCGTNQAVYTALKFPKATVIGSDLSPASLEMARRNAASLGLDNLTLRQESLNDVAYNAEFDYILNTGVIHHNADPAQPLANIARALRPNGVLELMVYNRYHRAFSTAFQKAVRAVTRYDGRTSTFEEEIAVARAMSTTPPIASSPRMASLHDAHESYFADTIIQPVEYSYTVESLGELAAECGLALSLPCYNQFDASVGRSWALAFSTPELQARIDALPDVVRWQVANLLLLEDAPMLWFYLRHRRDTDDPRLDIAVDEAFLDRPFERAATTLRNQVRGPDFQYRPAAAAVPYPRLPEPGLLRDVVAKADGKQPMRQILRDLGVDTASHKAVSDIRMQTTTPQAPYLRAV